MTNPSYKKKLIEVAIPLEKINEASAREKSIRHGHPSTLHLWWARRPLAACRAVLFAQLVDDPSGHPDKFSTPEAVEVERKRLFDIIEELVIWENSTNEEVLEKARAEIRKSCGGELPPVYDPFSGGGSIPLEAQRLGLPAYGSDLNPVAVMIGKAMIEIPPKFKDMPPVHRGGKERNHYRNAEGLAEDVGFYGEWMREKAFERIGHLYPQVDLSKEYGGGKATVIAWMWARTVPSPDPAFSDVQVPIASSFLLSSKKGKEVWIEPTVDRAKKTISFRIRKGGAKAELEKAAAGTKAGRGANFVCLLSATAITPDHVKTNGKSGRMGQTLIAIVAEGKNGRVYLEPIPQHESLARSAKPEWEPETSLPNDPRNFWTVDYGLTKFGDLFTNRQLVALNTFSELVHEARAKIEKDALATGLASDAIPVRNDGKGAKAYAEAVSVYLAFAVDRAADAWSAQVSWRNSVEASRSTFARQALPMVWDYVELNPFSTSNGNWNDASIMWVQKALNGVLPAANGSLTQGDAQTVKMPREPVISTDPPYYDNIVYADLSDYFYVWLRRLVGTSYPELTSTLAVPKAEELVATPYRHGGRDNAEAFFLNGMKKAVANMVDQGSNQHPAAIYYAFKQSEVAEEGLASTGWATFIQAVIDSGYSILRTWPLRTEKPGRMISVGTNALANSVVLVCRKKDETVGLISRAEFIRALKRELPDALRDLLAANIAPSDIPQASIGPGMGIFSRHSAVLESDDTPMSVKSALQLINREVDEYLNDVVGEFDADTRLAITWFEQFGTGAGPYGTADNIARGRGISVESAKHAGVLDSSAGKVRVLKREELPEDWNPAEDKHLTVWECCQHVVRALEIGGEFEAAVLIRAIGPAMAENVKDLAYVLYNICEKRKDAKEATSYNALIAVWPDLTRLAASSETASRGGQYSMAV
jgi:putative DNA methylase